MQHLTTLATAAHVRTTNAPSLVADLLAARRHDDEGQTTAEYVAVIVLIAAVITVAATNDGIRQAIVDTIKAAFGNVEDQVSGA